MFTMDLNAQNSIQTTVGPGISNISYKRLDDKKQQDPACELIILLFFEDITYNYYINKIEEINTFKLKMLASLSHEMRTPLNCSIGLQQIMIEDIQ